MATPPTTEDEEHRKELARIGKAVGDERRKRRWTRNRLADTAGISWRTIQQIESGKGARLDLLMLTLSALGLRIKLANADGHTHIYQRVCLLCGEVA